MSHGEQCILFLAGAQECLHCSGQATSAPPMGRGGLCCQCVTLEHDLGVLGGRFDGP
jgi:hypothetical protein